MATLQLNKETYIPGSKIESVEELRGIAILLVILSHISNIAGIPNVLRGEIGVDVFVIISGFVLALSSVETPVKKFIQGRFFRVVPSYWIALVSFIFLNAFILDKEFSITSIFLHTLGIHGFASESHFFEINQSFWFISLIVLAYSLFLLARESIDDMPRLIFTGALVTLAVTIFYMSLGHVDGLATIAARIPGFFLGMIGGRLYLKGTLDIKSGSFIAIASLIFYYHFASGTIFATTIAAIYVIAAWIGLRKIVKKSALGRPLLISLASIGAISYEVFLFHQPLIQEFNLHALSSWFGVDSPTKGTIMLGVAGGLIVAVAASMVCRFITSGALRRLIIGKLTT